MRTLFATALALLVGAACSMDEQRRTFSPDAAGHADAASEAETGPPSVEVPDAGDSADPRESADAGTLCDLPFDSVGAPPATPYSGTVFVDPNWLTSADPSSFRGLRALGRGDRQMFDRRTESFGIVNAYLFEAQFGSQVTVEVQVNPEFSAEVAAEHARVYSEEIGRLPAFLFSDLQTVWIHDGEYVFGGGNNNILIHTIQGETYRRGGFLEEVLLHEAAHTSLDRYHGASARWQEAKRADGSAISAYAQKHPDREDLAETLGPYLVERFLPDRIRPNDSETIRRTIPNRLRYLDCLELSLAPLP